MPQNHSAVVETKLLGVRVHVIRRIFGEPSSSFQYNGRHVLFYDALQSLFFEIQNDVVVNCESVIDRRESFRAAASPNTQCFIDTLTSTISGTVHDLSQKSLAIFTRDEIVVDLDDTAILRFSLPVSDSMHSFEIAGTLLRVSEIEGIRKLIFLFSKHDLQPMDAMMLLAYILEKQYQVAIEAKAERGRHAMAVPPGVDSVEKALLTIR